MGTSRHTQEIAVPVAETVFGTLETPSSDLPPLSDAIDLDALEALVPAEAPPDVSVAFSYQGLRVVVHSGRVVCAHPLREEADWPTDADTAEEY